MTKLFLDIETIPSQLPWVREHIIDTIKPPGTIKKQETLDKWYSETMPEAVDEAMSKTSFDGAMCHVIAIGYAIDDEPADYFYCANPLEDEAERIDGFFQMVNKLSFPDIVGHNVTQFDLRVLRQRAIILGVSVPRNIPWAAKPWDKNPFDTMMQWDAQNKVSLDKLAKAMGINGKDEMNGSMVYDYWQKGKHQEIVDYCKRDVDLVRSVYSRFNTAFSE